MVRRAEWRRDNIHAGLNHPGHMCRYYLPIDCMELLYINFFNIDYTNILEICPFNENIVSFVPE